MREFLTQRFAALAPIGFMILLAAVSFWLERAVHSGAAPDKAPRHDPDFWTENFNIKSFDKDGVLQNTLTATHMVHYPDDDTTQVTRLRIRYHRQPPVEITAQQGFIGPDGDEILLRDDVRITRGTASRQPPMQILTRELAIHSKQEKAESLGPVTVIQGASKMHGSGIEVDNKTGIAILKGPVTGTIFPKRSK